MVLASGACIASEADKAMANDSQRAAAEELKKKVIRL
jgi:hypothetical protein